MGLKLITLIVIVVAVGILQLAGFNLTGFVASQLTGQQTVSSEASQLSTEEGLAAFLENYSSTHYQSVESMSDIGYSCLILADALKTEGFPAEIAIGNVKGTSDDIVRFDDAWIVINVEDNPTAIDAQYNRIITEHENQLFYKGYSFSNPDDFREYTRLKNEHESLSNIIGIMEDKYNKCIVLLTNMSLEFDQEYGGKRATDQSLSERAKVHKKLGECQAFSDMLLSERQALGYLEQSISNKVLSTAIKLE